MARRDDRGTDRRRRTREGFSHRPFLELRRSYRARENEAPHEVAPPMPGPSEQGDPTDDRELFLREMRDVQPYPVELRKRVVPSPAGRRRSPYARALRPAYDLRELLRGDEFPFDISFGHEYVEGLASGQDRRIVRHLAAGKFAWRMHLDLHGFTVPEARMKLDGFLSEAIAREERCVLIVHGRGLNSPGEPVLKRAVVDRLSRGRWARHVLAFVSARPCDGGTGALYVLLRKRQPAKPDICVMNGPGK